MDVTFYPTHCPRFQTLRFTEGKPEPDLRTLTEGGYVKITVIGTQEYIDSLEMAEIKAKVLEDYKPINLIMSNPTITGSIPTTDEVAVSRLMSDEELVEKIIATDESSMLPDKLRYDVGVKYLRRAKK